MTRDLARQVSTALEGAGYVVDVAHDGEEGHFLGDTEPYDAVVLDLGLPEVDGITVLERWRVNRHSILTPYRRAKLTPPERHGGGCPGSP